MKNSSSSLSEASYIHCGLLLWEFLKKTNTFNHLESHQCDHYIVKRSKERMFPLLPSFSLWPSLGFSVSPGTARNLYRKESQSMSVLLPKSLERAAFRSGSFCLQLEMICWKSLCKIQMNSSRNSLELGSAHEDSQSVMVWLLTFRATLFQSFKGKILKMELFCFCCVLWLHGLICPHGKFMLLFNAVQLRRGNPLVQYNMRGNFMFINLVLLICFIDTAPFSSMESRSNLCFPLVHFMCTTSLWSKVNCECDWLKVTQQGCQTDPSSQQGQKLGGQSDVVMILLVVHP